ncbi:MAG: AEC family transporter [Lachnospiraceae bacterium]
MEYVNLVIGQIVIFIIYATLGIVMIKTKILEKDGLQILARMITKILLPLLIFTNCINGTTREIFFESLTILALAIVMYGILFISCKILASAFRLEGNEKKVYRACTMFGNVGFMGIPIVGAIFPERGVLYIAIFTVIDQLLLWTVGVELASPVDHMEKKSTKEKLLKMISPATVGIVLAVIIILFKIQIPEILNTALTKTGAAATPLAMIYLGGVFCNTNLIKYLGRKELYGAVLIKMCIMPLILVSLFKLFPFISSEMGITIGILCALPSMSSMAMIFQSQKSDVEYGASMIFFTTICSIITVPIVCYFIG